MKMSDHGLRLLETWEGCKLHAYNDAAGLRTIGIGHLLTKSELSTRTLNINGQSVVWDHGITNQQALDLLAQDVIPAESSVNGHVKVELSQNQFDALVSFAFNCGTNAFETSTLLKLLNLGEYDKVPGQLLLWTKAGGKRCDGLVTRRNNEIKLWNGQV